MGKFDPKPINSGRVKDKRLDQLNIVQKEKRRRKDRLNYLKAQIELGRAPQIRRSATPEILKLYKNAGLDLAIYFPGAYSNETNINKTIKSEHKALRASIRDLMPTDVPIKHAKMLIDHVLTDRLPKSLVSKLSVRGIAAYYEQQTVMLESARELRIQMIPAKAKGRKGGIKSALRRDRLK